MKEKLMDEQKNKIFLISHTIKRSLTILLAMIIIITGIPNNFQRKMGLVTESYASTTLQNPSIVTDSSMGSGKKVTWDCVWFGSYPQTEIVDQASTSGTYSKDWEKESDYEVNESLYKILQDEDEWDNNGDKIISGTKYHRIRKEDATGVHFGNRSDYEWSDTHTYHFFRYDRIKWRVLNISDNQLFLISDLVLDNQKYNNLSRVVTWKTSTVRSWLNGYSSDCNLNGEDCSNNNFIDAAFSLSEQELIKTTQLETKRLNILGNAKITNDDITNDKIFLLSINEAGSESYGMASGNDGDNEARRCKSSTYAKAMGTSSVDYVTFGNYSGHLYLSNCRWWLRNTREWTAKYNYKNAACIGYDGVNLNYTDGISVNTDYVGIRPAIMLRLSSEDLWSYAGTVCSDGTDNEITASDKQNDEGTTTKYTISGKSNHYYGMNRTLDEENKKNLKEYIDNYTDAYNTYIERVNNKVEILEKDEGTNTSISFVEQAKALKKKEKIYIRCLNNYDEEAELAAYEAFARVMTDIGEKAGVDFSKINFKEADSAITNKIYNWIMDNRINRSYSLDSKVGNKQVSAECSILFGMGTIIITEKKSKTEYRFSCFPSFEGAKNIISQYIIALRDLEQGALDNVKYALIKDILNNEIGNVIEKDVEKAFTSHVNNRLESVGIKDLSDTVIKCGTYYNKVNRLYKSLANINDKSIGELTDFLLAENSGGDFASGAYKKVRETQKQLKEKINDYYMNGSITKPVEKNPLDKFLDWVTVKFFCPIEIEIFDESGRKVGFIGEEDIYADDCIIVEKIGESKIIHTPKNQSYSYKINGTDEGQVSCVFESFSNGLPDGRVTYQNIEVDGDTNIEANVEANSTGTQIEMESDNGFIQGNLIKADTDAVVQINAESSSGGKTCGAGSYIKGDKATITALADENYSFLGWYDTTGELVTVKHEYSFVALDNKSFTAKFAKKESSVNLDAANEVLDLLIDLCIETVNKNKVEEVRKAYDSLTNEQKQLIDSDSLKILTDLEEYYSSQIDAHGDLIEEGQCGDNLTWRLYEDGDLIISGIGDMWDFKPNSGNTKPWLQYKNDIKRVVVEEGVTSIGGWAFGPLEELEEVVLPKSIRETGFRAFGNCKKLHTITIPEGVEVISQATFVGCESLISINLPNSIKEIGMLAFESSGLKSITIPEKITSIGDSAFSGTQLKEVVIPESVTYLGENAFKWCNNLESVKINGKIEDISYGLFWQCSMLKEVSLNSEIKKIGSNAFYECERLQHIELPNSVVEIGSMAFENCKSLETIKFPDSVTNIYSAAFAGCSSLKEITFSEKLQIIDEYAFSGCEKLENITIPETVKLIQKAAFKNCSNLKESIIKGDQTELKDGAFYTRADGEDDKGGPSAYYYEGDMVIKAPKDSLAEQFAQKYGIKFEELHLEHIWDNGKVTKAPTCTEEGVMTYSCTGCEETKTEFIKALGHKPVIDSAKPATEKNTGLTEGSHCSVCGTILKKQEVVPILNSPAQEASTETTAKAPTSTTGSSTVGNNNTQGTTGNQIIPVSSIKISGLSKKIAAGKKIKLTATVLPENAANKKIMWSTSNKKIATVNQNGIVSIKKKSGGKTVSIIAMATDGSGMKAVWKIKSMKGVVKGVTLTGAKKTIKAGKSIRIKATVKATKGANKKLMWTSSNPKWVTVSSKGVVKALKAGKGKTVKITVLATDGSNVRKVIKMRVN